MLLLVSGLAACAGGEPPAPRLAVLRGQVQRVGRPVRATVHVHAYLQLEGEDPWAPWRGYGAIEDLLRAPALANAPVAVTATDDEGRFEMTGLAAGCYEVIATDEEGATTVRGIAIPLGGARQEIRLRVPAEPVVFEARVRFDDGRPFVGLVGVEDADSFGWWWPPGWCGERIVATDAEGRVRIEGLARGPARVTVHVPGVFRLTPPGVDLPLEGPLEIVVPDRDSNVEGEVVATETGTPIAGARVIAWGGDRSFLLRGTETNADGRFRLALPPGERTFTALGPGRCRSEVRLAAEDRGPVKVGLPRASRLEGRVLRADDGRPVAGIPVFVGTWQHERPYWMPWRTLTDAQGRFRFTSLPAGDLEVFARGQELASPHLDRMGAGGWDPHAVSLVSGETAQRDIEVEPIALIRGRVVNEDGAPIQGAVVVGPDDENWVERWRKEVGLAGTATDGEGRFRVAVSRPDRETSTWVWPSGGPGVEATVEPDDRDAELVVRCPTGRWVDVLVRSAEDGTPLQGAHLRREWFNFAPAGGTSRLQTDQAGRAAVGPIGQNAWFLCVTKAGYAPETVEIEADQDEPRIVEMARGRHVRGRVMLPEGVPADRCSIRLENHLTRTSCGLPWEVAVEADGTFELHDLGDDPVEVYARLPMDGEVLWTSSSLSPDQEEVVLSFPPRAEVRSIHVRVVGGSGELVPNAGVTPRVDTAERRECPETVLDSGQGEVRLPSGAATFYLLVQPPEGGPWGRAVAGPFEAEAEAVEVHLSAGVSLRGHVSDAHGKGVRGAEVIAEPPDDEEEPLTHWPDSPSTRTDDEGSFVFRGLTAGRYRLRVYGPPFLSSPSPRDVNTTDGPVTFVLTPMVDVRITVLDDEGAAVSGATIGLDPTPDRLLEGSRTDELGRVSIRGLDPATTYDLHVVPPASEPLLQDEHVEAWRPENTTFRLRRLQEIQGRVVFEDGTPAVDAVVVGPGNEHAMTDEAGRFRLIGPFHGDVEVEAWKRLRDPYRRLTSEKTHAKPGATDVLLIVREGDK